MTKITKLGRIIEISSKAVKNNKTMYMFKLDEEGDDGQKIIFSSFKEEKVETGDLVSVELLENIQNGKRYLNLSKLEKLSSISNINKQEKMTNKEVLEEKRQLSIITQSTFNMAWEIIKYVDERDKSNLTKELLLEETLLLREKILKSLEGKI